MAWTRGKSCICRIELDCVDMPFDERSTIPGSGGTHCALVHDSRPDCGNPRRAVHHSMPPRGRVTSTRQPGVSLRTNWQSVARDAPAIAVFEIKIINQRRRGRFKYHCISDSQSGSTPKSRPLTGFKWPGQTGQFFFRRKSNVSCRIVRRTKGHPEREDRGTNQATKTRVQFFVNDQIRVQNIKQLRIKTPISSPNLIYSCLISRNNLSSVIPCQINDRLS